MKLPQLERILARDVRAVAKALTLVENSEPAAVADLVKQLYPHSGKATIVGVTGSPGVGKSTLVDKLALHYRRNKRTVGIVAVDPTSPFSGGAILGDRVRMQSLSTDPGVFIRSMATRGKLGGLASAVGDAVLVLDAAGFDILIVETVGVGQDEVDIVKTAHVTLVILVPGMGDDIQTIKAGIMEIGDVLVINKADRDGVLQTQRELEALLTLSPRQDGWTPPILQTVAPESRGLEEVAQAVEGYLQFRGRPDYDPSRERRFCRERLIEMIADRVVRKLLQTHPEEVLDRYAEQIRKYERDPYSIVDELLAATEEA